MRHREETTVVRREPVLGILGGGQLGRMLALVARRMNFRTVVWSGGHGSSAAEVADEVIDLPFGDRRAFERFVSQATMATVEFENIPAATLRAVAGRVDLHPSPVVVETCQNRWLEKSFLRRHGFPCAAFERVRDARDLAAAMGRIEGPWVLKTAESGYDGHGQLRVGVGENPEEIWRSFGAQAGVLEQWIPLQSEISVVVARGADGACEVYDPAENRHRDGILDWSVAPARVPGYSADQATTTAVDLARALDFRGVMCVEFFVAKDGRLLVNEIAPRPHNSGHHTLDACVTSQFEQQLRAVAGLPLGSTRLLSPVAMLNLTGEMWPAGRAPDWLPMLADGSAILHLYGKKGASPRRKMGHVNFLGRSAGEALARAVGIRERWLHETAQVVQESFT